MKYTKLSTLISTFVVGASLCLSPLASAQPNENTPQRMQGERHSSSMQMSPMRDAAMQMSDFNVKALLQQLTLSDEQKDKVQSIVKNTQETLRDISDNEQQNQQELRTLMRSTEYDKKAIAKLAKAQGTALTKRIETMAAAKAEVIAVLTDEQKQQLEELHQQHIDQPRNKKGK